MNVREKKGLKPFKQIFVHKSVLPKAKSMAESNTRALLMKRKGKRKSG